jgi:flagellar biosynthesis/type III secretory pathway protein FliH
MAKAVFSREHFTHKKGLLFAPLVHHDSGTATEKVTEQTPPLDATAQELLVTGELSVLSEERDTGIDAQKIEEVRAEAFAQGLAQGLEQGLQQAQQAQTQNEREQLEAQHTAQMQALLQAIDHKVQALAEDPVQLQAPLKRLALHLAEQLVLGELSLSPQAIERLIDRCIEILDVPDTSTLVVELSHADMALLQSQQRAEGQPKPAWRMQADSLLLPGSVRVRADDAVVSDLIENRLESLAHSLLGDTSQWQPQSAFEPSRLASRLASQRGSAQTVEDAEARPHVRNVDPVTVTATPEIDMESESEDDPERHTYEAHEVMSAAAPASKVMTQNFADALTEITLDLDKLDG